MSVAAAAFHTESGIDVLDGAALLTEMLARPAWHAQAACRGAGPADYFPKRGHENREPSRGVRRLCRTCPVRLECLTFALDGSGIGGDRAGIWGGTTERQRRRARQRGLDALQLLAELDAA
jgi:WhiB family transcriptional regulator, redox-sensing transcriptional regulator